MKPEYRLPPITLPGLVVPIRFFLYAWAAEEQIFWIVPIIGTGFQGLGLVLTRFSLTSYLVDAFKTHAAPNLAVVLLLRSITGSTLSLVAVPPYDNLGYGWDNSLLGFIALAFIPVPMLFLKYGEIIRLNSKFVAIE